MTKVEDEPRIGVWIENGLVYRSDIGESNNPHVPRPGHPPEEVAEVLAKLQNLACEGRIPKHKEHTDIDDLIDLLNKISFEKSRYITEEGKNLLSESLR